MMTKLTALLTVALASASSARADILMVDLNLNFDEVKAARQAAAARGEKLILLPEISDRVRIE